MDGEHVNGDDLEHACAAERGGAMLEEGPKLLQHSTGYSRKTLHPEDHNTFQKPEGGFKLNNLRKFLRINTKTITITAP